MRFSLVTHGRDCPEGLRDVRGFATKFYTSEGNWDLVGNNIPVSPALSSILTVSTFTCWTLHVALCPVGIM